MLTLGDIIARARSASGNLEAWLVEADPDLAARLREAATAQGQSPAQFARAAIVDFDRHAEPEAWTRLTGQLHDSQDPGLVCIRTMVLWRLADPMDEPLETS